MRYFTEVFKNNLAASPDVLLNIELRIVLFRTAPSGEVSYDYGTIPTVQKLLDGNYPGWEVVDDPGYPFAATVRVSPVTVGKVVYTVFQAFLLTELTGKVGATALGIEAVGTMWGETNPLIMVTDVPFPGGRTVLAADDQITAYVDEDAGDLRWMFAWNSDPDGAVRVSSLTYGDLAVSVGPPDFQEAHHFDAWLYPQRVNYIANPSFEAIDNFFWGTNGTFARVPSEMGGFAGEFTGADVVVESNIFPIDNHDGLWTTQLLVKGTGLLSVGMVYWSERYDQTYVDWGDERWGLNPDTFLPIKVIRQTAEAIEGMLRIQVTGGTGIVIDHILMEPGPLLDWPYFDGDEQYGAPDDFSWYGERGASYSLWYNNKRSIISRIFTRPTYTEGTVYTEQEDAGLAYNWVPAGTVVDYHLDVLRVEDLKKPPIPKNGVLPDSETDPEFGVPVPDNVLTVQYDVVLDSKDSEEVFIAGGP